MLDIVVMILEKLHSVAARGHRAPDQHNRNSKDVDLLVEIGDEMIALEHTSIDYSRQARRVSDFWRRVHSHVIDLRDRLIAQLPGGEYALSFWGTPAVAPREFPQLVDAIEAWVLEVVSRLPPSTTGQIRMGRFASGAKAADVRLSRYAPDPLLCEPATVEVFAYDACPDGPGSQPMGDVESKAATLRHAFADKVPKLATYKELGARTILVVQDVCREAMGFDTLGCGLHLLQTDYAGLLDMVVVVYASELPWSLRYGARESVNDRDLRRTNWWLCVPEDGLLIQNDWVLGSRRTIERADPVAFERVIRADAVADEPWGRQWSRLA